MLNSHQVRILSVVWAEFQPAREEENVPISFSSGSKRMFFFNDPLLNGTLELLRTLLILNKGQCIYLIRVIKTNCVGI